MRFFIRDCFEPFNESIGQFDFAASHFLLHCANSEEALGNFASNVVKALKPGGKLLLVQSQLPRTVADQNVIRDLRGKLTPLISEVGGGDHCFVNIPVLLEGKTAFTFQANIWSKEKLMKNLEDAGFVNVKLLKPAYSPHVNASAAQKMENMDDPHLLFIAAEKAMN